MNKLLFVIPVLTLLATTGVASAREVTKAWTVKGVSTNDDMSKLQTAVSKLEGVKKVTGDKTVMRVTFDDQRVDETKIRNAVTAAGTFTLGGRYIAHASAKTGKTEKGGKADAPAPAANK